MNNNLSEKSSKRLNELRTKAGLTMEKLANMIGVSKGTISKWEKGSIKNMRQDKVQMLADIFHVSPTYIMGYEEDDIKREENFVKAYKSLPSELQSLVDNLIATLLSKQ
jgi:transcriptional regulator with XRE-family HTH domain